MAPGAEVPLTWRPMSTVPISEGGPPVLLLTNTGVVEARYAAGEWYETEYGREYNGPVWVCCDDEFQIEIDESSKDQSDWSHHPALGWLPRSVLPAETAIAKAEGK